MNAFAPGGIGIVRRQRVNLHAEVEQLIVSVGATIRAKGGARSLGTS
jgi:hypothetical protein